MKKATRTISINDALDLHFTSDKDGGEILDTRVEITNSIDGNRNDTLVLCWIAGNTIDSFAAEFTALIGKYRI